MSKALCASSLKKPTLPRLIPLNFLLFFVVFLHRGVISEFPQYYSSLAPTFCLKGVFSLFSSLDYSCQFKMKIGNCIDIQTNHYCVCGGVYTDKGSYRFADGFTFEEIGEIPELPPKWVDFLSKPTEQKRYTQNQENNCKES